MIQITLLQVPVYVFFLERAKKLFVFIPMLVFIRSVKVFLNPLFREKKESDLEESASR